ncbi:MAG: hypothetical protein R2690_08080 [Acidimicrobiales bacterium]
MTTSICTWVTSLVMRVISDGAPSVATSWPEEAGDPVEQVRAHVAAEAHGDLRREERGADGEADLHDRHAEHHAAHAHDVGGVLVGDALVDDVGIERGQDQRRHRLDG